MIGLAISDLQEDLVAALKADATLTGLVTGVFDYVPSRTAYPYVVVGEYTEIPDNTLRAEGREVTATIHTWDGANPGAASQALGTKRLRQIGDRVSEVVKGTAYSPASLGVSRVEQEFAQTLREIDEDTQSELRHLVQRFRFRLYER